MGRQRFAWLGVGAAMAVAMAIAFYAPTSRTQAPPAQSGQTVTLDDQLIYDGPNLGDISKPDCIEIAPMSEPGSMTPGSWTGVSETIFGSILARTGIIPGQTNPSTLAPRTEVSYKGAPGFIDIIDPSQVLNEPKDGPKGTRMTFGYFVRITQGPVTREFFLLMSYDFIDEGKATGNPSAFEVFVFGPLPTPNMYGGADPNALIPLRDGLAVSPDGVLLPSVPLNIAKQDNYKGDKVPPNTPVTPGVEEKGQGCFACHADRADSFPNSTAPFPWTATFGQFQTALKARAVKPNCPPPAAGVLQNSVLQGNVLQQGALPGGGSGAGGGETGGSQGNGVLQGVGANPPPVNQPNTHVEEGGSSEKNGQGEGQSQAPKAQPGKP